MKNCHHGLIMRSRLTARPPLIEERILIPPWAVGNQPPTRFCTGKHIHIYIYIYLHTERYSFKLQSEKSSPAASPNQICFQNLFWAQGQPVTSPADSFARRQQCLDAAVGTDGRVFHWFWHQQWWISFLFVLRHLHGNIPIYISLPWVRSLML